VSAADDAMAAAEDRDARIRAHRCEFMHATETLSVACDAAVTARKTARAVAEFGSNRALVAAVALEKAAADLVIIAANELAAVVARAES